jgi:Uncharacterised nucleotidyltransferase
MPTARRAEFDALLALCLGADTVSHPAGSPELDWARLRSLSARHRVDGLVAMRLACDELSGVPDDVRAEFQASHRAQSLDYLSRAGETLRLSRSLEARGVATIVLKGCVVAEQLYAPHPAVRQSIDIDLLVAPATFDAAEDGLREEGYIRVGPPPGLPGSARSMALHLLNAFEFVHPASGLTVELHHRPLNDPAKVDEPFTTLLARSVPFPIGGGTVRALAPLDAAVFLCSHGAGHGYFRLKWLVDIDRLLRGKDKAWLHAIRAHARALRCERDAMLSMALLAELTGGPAPALTESERRAMAPLVAFANAAMRREVRPDSARFAFADLGVWLHELWAHMRLVESRRSAGFRILTHLCNQNDLYSLKLGAQWRMLYAVLGPPLAVGRLLRRALRPGKKTPP